MSEITLTVHHAAGLHARPASLFVKEAGKYRSKVTVQHGERTANAKSMLSVLTLGVNQGAVITITATGEDEDAAIAGLQALIENNFGEKQ
ncbi:MAG: HPr family phosphocarrier protein [Anaerolineae bacterium]|nr:HPr family phosphocarrier protein [Anaerolineae bacterium]